MKIENISMPSRNTIEEAIAISASISLKIACEKNFKSIEIQKVADVVSGGTPDTSNPNFWNGNIVWVTPKDLGRQHDIEIMDSERKITVDGLKSSSARLLPKGTVLLSSRAPIGHLAIAGIPLSTNQGFKNIICSEKLDNRYLFHMLRGSIDELQSKGRGNTFKEIPARVVKDFRIPIPDLDVQQSIASFLDTLYLRLSGEEIELPELPSPLEEQKRIVARIESLMTRIEEARRLRGEAVEEGEKLLVEESGNVYVSLSESWGIKKLIDISEQITDGTHKTPMYVSEGVPFLSVKDVTGGKISFSDVKYITEEEHAQLIKRCKPEKGDVLLTKVGTTGYAKVVDVDREFSIFVSLCLIKVKKDRVLPEYIEHILNSKNIRELSEKHTRGVGNKNLVLRFIKEYPIPLPPLPVQRRIVAYLDSLQTKVNELKRLQVETEKEMEELIPSILDKAFKGEL